MTQVYIVPQIIVVVDLQICLNQVRAGFNYPRDEIHSLCSKHTTFYQEFFFPSKCKGIKIFPSSISTHLFHQKKPIQLLRIIQTSWCSFVSSPLNPPSPQSDPILTIRFSILDHYFILFIQLFTFRLNFKYPPSPTHLKV